ncbi:MAG: hypothetical protein K0A89_12375 [ANME-2 cluster archaeon]|nr:hypothetical protein [ANME-2 cluster archaeon]
MKHILTRRVKDQGFRSCSECRSTELEYFGRVYIEGELFSFPYCRQCGLVQWHVVSGFHLTLEKLYEVFLQLAEELGLSRDGILAGLEHIKQRKGDEGYSDDVVILREVFEIL